MWFNRVGMTQTWRTIRRKLGGEGINFNVLCFMFCVLCFMFDIWKYKYLLLMCLKLSENLINLDAAKPNHKPTQLKVGVTLFLQWKWVHPTTVNFSPTSRQVRARKFGIKAQLNLFIKVDQEKHRVTWPLTYFKYYFLTLVCLSLLPPNTNSKLSWLLQCYTYSNKQTFQYCQNPG